MKDAASLPVIHVLAIDLGIDALPSLALSREPVEAGIMQEPPRSVKERLFNRKVFLRSLYIGLIVAAGAMHGCLSAWSAGDWHLGMSLDPNDPCVPERHYDDFCRHSCGPGWKCSRMQDQQGFDIQDQR